MPGKAEVRTVVSARALTKRYGEFTAVDGIEFDIAAGECFGMLGPNGAGKTSTMRMIGCATPVTAGRLDVLGLRVGVDDRRIKSRIGVVPQEDNLDEELTVEENLVVYAGYFGISGRTARARAGELLEFMQLAGRRSDRVAALSGGMKRRLVIARALVNEPEVVLLDEPTTGLDPQARHLIWERLRTLKEAGATLVLTTHYMEEAAHLCDRLVIMDRARILVCGSPDGLIRELIPRHVVEVPADVARSLDGELADVSAPATSVQVLADRVLFHAEDAEPIVRALTEAGVEEARLRYRMSSLEDVFLKLTGRTIEA
jgi:lipooligosaccharide transport system ATP-binding protein